MRSALAERLHIATAIADNKVSAPSDRLKALEFMARYGLGPRNATQKLEHTGNGITLELVMRDESARGES